MNNADADHDSDTRIKPEDIDRLAWKDEMVILALAEHGGAATSRELRGDLEPVLGKDDFSPKLAYRLDKLADIGEDGTGLVDKKESDKTAQNGETLNKAVLTDEAREWLYEYDWHSELVDRRENLDELSEERRLRVVQQELNRLSAEIEEFRQVAEDSEAFSERLDDADLISMRDSVEKLSGKIGHIDRRLREIESPSGDETVPGYKNLDGRMADVEEEVEDIREDLDEFVAGWEDGIRDINKEVGEIRRELNQMQGQDARHGSLEDLWTLAMLNNVMLTSSTGVGLNIDQFTVAGSDYARVSQHVFD